MLREMMKRKKVIETTHGEKKNTAQRILQYLYTKCANCICCKRVHASYADIQ